MVDFSQFVFFVKKRLRKKKFDFLEEDFDVKVSYFIQMLGIFFIVSLEEFRVGNFFLVLNVFGSLNVIIGKIV